jgi:hypothetical protein
MVSIFNQKIAGMLDAASQIEVSQISWARVLGRAGVFPPT